MGLNLKQNDLVKDLLRLEIDPKSHAAWTGGKQKLMDKGRISKFNKNFKILNQIRKLNDKCPFDANGNCCLVIENTTLTFKKLQTFKNYTK